MLVNVLHKKNLRLLYSNNYEIYIVIRGMGEQNILSKDFNISEPFEVLINGIKNDSCHKACYLQKEINTVILKFNTQLNSFEKMFNELSFR